MATTIFDAALSTTFQPSRPVQFTAEKITVDFKAVITQAATRVLWYFEFTADDPNLAATEWYREAAEENQGAGVVNMPAVVRCLTDNGVANLPVGTHQMSQQFLRSHRYYRIQAALAAGGGTARLTIRDIFGDVPQSI